MMKKIIAMKSGSEKTVKILLVKNIFDKYLGGANVYQVPCGNVFFDSFDDIEVCMFSNGALSLCGLGEHKKKFENSFEFGDFVKKYLESKKKIVVDKANKTAVQLGGRKIQLRRK